MKQSQVFFLTAAVYVAPVVSDPVRLALAGICVVIGSIILYKGD